MSFFYTSKPKPILYHFSKDRRIRGHVINSGPMVVAYIYDNRTDELILSRRFNKKEVREANTWMYEHLDCPLFTLLESLPTVSK